MSELGWRDAIIKVLQDSPQAMHYADIAEAIVENGLRTNVGATPAATVNSIISTSLNTDEDSPFIRVDRGQYWLRQRAEVPPATTTDETAGEAAGTGLINAFGMYWSRSQVVWTVAPRLLGQQQSASSSVDFSGQKGVYMLHDGRSVVYVGRTTDQPLGIRLRQHISDRLNGRWDRFSWFGIYPVDKATGALMSETVPQLETSSLIATMEALLIEGLEPPQNRKRGDDFRAVEFLQVQDPDIKKNEILALIESLKQKL